jgi:anti-sigma factor RsiW
MNCDRAAQVHAYHDDGLAMSDRAALEAHLDECADCRSLLADLRGISNLIASAPLSAMSPEAMARLSKTWHAARDRGLLRITSWLTAAAAAVLIGTLLMFHDRTPPTSTIIAVSEPAWETAAVMPPLNADENVPEIVALATWMANDLSYGTAGVGAERQ